MSEEPPFVLAIDVGSSSVRASLYDRRARLVPGSLATRATALTMTLDGGAEADPRSLAEHVEAAVDEALAQAGARGGQIAGVGLDTMAFAACGVDVAGAAVTPFYTYADTRARHEVASLRSEMDLAAVYQRTGCPLHTAYLPARLRWFERARPERRGQVARWLDVGTFLLSRWLGKGDVPVSYSVASWSGLLDRHRLEWDSELLGALKLGEAALPPLDDYSRGERGLAPSYANRWPALADKPFFLAVGDGAAANVGSGCVTPSRVALTVGTTGALRVLLPGVTPEVPAGLWAYKVGASETLLGGALSEGGNVFAWATSALRLPPPEQLEGALGRLPPDGHGLTVLPFLTGERSPGWSNDARAAIAGLHASTSGLEMLQACLEAVSYRFALVARLLRPHLSEAHEVVASGGAMSRSPYWVQLMADVLGRRVLFSRREELTSRGTAILALRALGEWATLDAVPLEAEAVHDPDPSRAAAYQAAIERQHQLYDAVIGHGTEIGETIDAARRGR